MGGAAGEASSIRHNAGESGAGQSTVREGILLRVYDSHLGYDEPSQLLGDDVNSFAVKINNSFAAQRHRVDSSTS